MSDRDDNYKEIDITCEYDIGIPRNYSQIKRTRKIKLQWTIE